MRSNLVATTVLLIFLLVPSSPVDAGDEGSARNPTYPDRCDAEKRTGYVLVRFNISPEGKAIDLEVMESCPSDIFNESTLQAIREYEFKATGELQEDIRMIMPFTLSAPTESKPE